MSHASAGRRPPMCAAGNTSIIGTFVPNEVRDAQDLRLWALEIGEPETDGVNQAATDRRPGRISAVCSGAADRVRREAKMACGRFGCTVGADKASSPRLS